MSNKNSKKHYGLLTLLLLGLLALTGGNLYNHNTNINSRAAEVIIVPTMPSPSNVQLLGFDSTIRVNWTPPSDPNNEVAWQVLSAWEGTNLMGAKVLGRTANVADANGLVPGHTYIIKIQSMDSQGRLSNPAEANTVTMRQNPMPGAVFFENFNGPAGDANVLTNYFDMRTDEAVNEPGSINIDKRLIIPNENHFHTQIIGGPGHVAMYMRPRVPFDISDNQVHTFQFEMDLPPVQSGHGKWMNISFAQNVPNSAEDFGDNADGGFTNSLNFTIRGGEDTLEGRGKNFPEIITNINGTQSRSFAELPQYTGTNVRVPVVFKVSKTRAEMWINGTKVLEKTGFNLPWDRGYWYIAHRNYYTGRHFNSSRRPLPMNVQLIHWDTVHYDGVALSNTGSKQYTVKTYVEPGCNGVVNMQHNFIEGCTKHLLGTFTMNFNVQEDVTKAILAKLVFNGGDGQTVNVNLNGHATTVTGTGGLTKINMKDIDPSWLVQGQNSITFTGNNIDIAQVEMEVVYDIQRGYVDPPSAGMGMLTVTSNNFTIDRIASDPTVMNLTTYVYSLGSAAPLNYTAQVITDTPWLTITSGASGTLESPAVGGGIRPIMMSVNYANANVPHNDDDGQIAVVKVTGGTMPAYIAIRARQYDTRPVYIPGADYQPVMTTFNRDWVPGYGGGTPIPTSTLAPSSPPTNTPTPLLTTNPTPTPTRTLTPTPTRTPTPPIGATNTPVPTSTPVPTGTASAWSGQYFNNRNWSGTPVLTRQDGSVLSFDWGMNSPGPGVVVDNFSVRWTRNSVPFTAGRYRFSATVDDMMNVYVDNIRIRQFSYSPNVQTFNRCMTAGNHNLRVDFRDYYEEAVAMLSWARIGDCN